MATWLWLYCHFYLEEWVATGNLEFGRQKILLNIYSVYLSILKFQLDITGDGGKYLGDIWQYGQNKKIHC